MRVAIPRADSLANMLAIVCMYVSRESMGYGTCTRGSRLMLTESPLLEGGCFLYPESSVWRTPWKLASLCSNVAL